MKKLVIYDSNGYITECITSIENMMQSKRVYSVYHASDASKYSWAVYFDGKQLYFIN